MARRRVRRLLSNSGSEANETAFKVARQYHEQNGEPRRWKFVSRYRAYHGNSMGSVAATGAARKYRYEPLAPGFLHVAPRPLPLRLLRRPARVQPGVRQGHRAYHSLGAARDGRRGHHGAHHHRRRRARPARRLRRGSSKDCRKNGVLFIVDEVICGFGRTGRRFGYQHYGVKPDIVTMAKGITSAYLPLSATAVKREIFEAFKGTEEYDHRHVNTFGGNPAACALAVKNLEIMEEEDLSGRSAKMGERLRGKLAGLEDHPNVGEIRHKGLLFGIELVEDRETGPRPRPRGSRRSSPAAGERANRREERRHGGGLRCHHPRPLRWS